MQTRVSDPPDRLVMTLHTVVNGKSIQAEIEPRELLLDFLRNKMGLTGAKRSCDVEVCGACTVLVDGIPISSCSTLAYEVEGCQVTTVEGLEQEGQLHPIQQAFLEQTAIQCGFCTPGMVLTIKSMLDENPDPTPDLVRAYMSGNLCRCTGYWNILSAAQEAARRIGSIKTDKEKLP